MTRSLSRGLAKCSDKKVAIFIFAFFQRSFLDRVCTTLFGIYIYIFVIIEKIYSDYPLFTGLL